MPPLLTEMFTRLGTKLVLRVGRGRDGMGESLSSLEPIKVISSQSLNDSEVRVLQSLYISAQSLEPEPVKGLEARHSVDLLSAST